MATLGCELCGLVMWGGKIHLLLTISELMASDALPFLTMCMCWHGDDLFLSLTNPNIQFLPFFNSTLRVLQQIFLGTGNF